ncbi:MAG: EamA family transporter RarD [Verrucomicrobiota bacterium]|nr:EamA family transporter RarD [Verrucomicrobiota bacterium]
MRDDEGGGASQCLRVRSAAAHSREERTALLAGIGAFGFWGIIPIYWKFLASVPAAEILAHRFVWTTAFLVSLLTWQGRWAEVRAAMRTRRTMFYCLASGIAISCNWLMFIWAVNVGRVLETSLGYFMTPLVNVLFGAFFLRERLTRLQVASVILATVGVLNLAFGYGRVPWIALGLCVSWGFYGLLRKNSGTAAIPGLFFETTMLLPLAIVFLVFLHVRTGGIFGVPHWGLSLLLISSGFVTGLPLVWFGYAARHLRLTTIGFLQYIAPSGTFFLGVFLYHEPFTRAHLITFSLIWIALAMFTYEMIRLWRAQRPPPNAAPPIAD